MPIVFASSLPTIGVDRYLPFYQLIFHITSQSTLLSCLTIGYKLVHGAGRYLCLIYQKSGYPRMKWETVEEMIVRQSHDPYAEISLSLN